jgi:hypothetical protein
MHRKRKLSVSGPATKATLFKKFKEEIDAEKRKKIRLEWYLKQLLLEKEMLVKENEIEFAQAMQSISPLDTAAPASLPTNVRPLHATQTTITSAPVAIPVVSTHAAAPVPSSSSMLEEMTSTTSSPSSYSSFFSIKVEADEEEYPSIDDVASPGPTTEDTSSTISSLDELPIFEPLEESKPLEEIFSTEWEQTHCWWDEDELSQFLAVPPSLMV